MSTAPLGLVVALYEELRPLRRALQLHGLVPGPLHAEVAGTPVIALLCGPGADHAERAARRLVEELGCGRLLTIGFGGGLVDGLKAGETVVVTGCCTSPPSPLSAGGEGESRAPRSVADSPSPPAERGLGGEVCTPACTPWLTNLLAHDYRHGTCLTTTDLLPTPDAKRAAAEESGALVVDMETVAVARVAAEAGVPWMGVRVISDAVDEPLPEFVVRYFDRQSGGVRLLPMFGYILLRPGCWVQLARLARMSQRAGQQLALATVRAVEAAR